MSAAIRWLDNRFYPTLSDNWDDSLFRSLVEQHINAQTVLLDLGAGAGLVRQMNFRGQVASVVGIDPDPRVLDNPHLDEATVGLADSLPFGNASFDVVVADNVLEHLENPDAVFGEVARVLRPGGTFLFKTPNVHHYVPLIARLTPTAFHRRYNRLRGRSWVDTFPTRYRANCRRDIVRLCRASGLALDALRFVEGRPEYLRLSAVTYVPGILYERLVNSTRLLEGLRVVLLGIAKKHG